VFSNPDGEVVDGDLYLFIMDAIDGKLLGNGGNTLKGSTGVPCGYPSKAAALRGM
jgi:hypothetical protein